MFWAVVIGARSPVTPAGIGETHPRVCQLPEYRGAHDGTEGVALGPVVWSRLPRERRGPI
jgi:hypothetical protein